jgi:hypothetical protein
MTGLEKFEKHFAADLSGNRESDKEHIKRMDRLGSELDAESEQIRRRSEAKRKRLEEHVDSKTVDDFVSSLRTIPDEALKEKMLKLLDGTFNEPTMAEIRRRLAEEDE